MLRKGDIVLVAVMILVVAAGYYIINLTRSSGDGAVAVIKLNNEVVKKIDLNSVAGTELVRLEGKYSNVIAVEKGRIRFQDADCPDRLCVNTGWISLRGETAVCLPNKAMIVIEGEDTATDGIAY